MKNQNYINHIALVLDASGSMDVHRHEVVKVADQQIAYLAQRSKELDQETRITVYTFDYSHNIQCVFYDKDVLRMPSLKGHYVPNGQTALIDATLKSLIDLEKTPELYGEHSFLVYVLTDGAENASKMTSYDLEGRLRKLPDHWTVACFVPNAMGVMEAKKFGFMKDNIAVWDSTSAAGVQEAGETIRRATETFMTGRTSGVRGYKNLFQMQAGNLTPAALKGLGKLGPGQFRILAVKNESPIASFVEVETRRPYRLGEAYYQLTKAEKVQPHKAIALFDRKNFTVFTGKNARTVLGLPDHEVKVDPTNTSGYDIYIQSTSVNRKLVPGTNVLLVS
jgi:hypothetical protein